MRKHWLLVFLTFFPVLAFADIDSLSFAPPASDYSVVFLGNLFGVVDGVLHGNGSQIMGAIFSVFNAAVLALGGIIIMYTLMVSTMNTAHEGQMLGQKWSSIWVPMRSTLGLALLIPKTSGYCLMQVFVMWVVVQGVGAADKVWEAALGYLNRGGVIIHAQQDPTLGLLGQGASDIPTGAANILIGQVCMLGLQKQLETTRQNYLNAKNQNAGPCYSATSDPIPPPMDDFCNTAVPDFIGTVNAVSVQNKTPTQSTPFSVNMPNFESSSPYSNLNGICGQITWNPMSSVGNNFLSSAATTGSTYDVGGGVTLSASQYETAQMTRAIAVQQMYMDMSAVAQVMINNDPQISTENASTDPDATNDNFSAVATAQFGVPYTTSGAICTSYGQTCTTWGPFSSSSSNTQVLFNGTEFWGAVSDYNGIMAPTLNLYNMIQDGSSAGAERQFINQANSQGWITAGAYFFNLVSLNGNAVKGGAQEDSNSGLNPSNNNKSFKMSTFANLCNGSNNVTNGNGVVCTWLGNNATTQINQVKYIIDGTFLPNSQIPPTPNMTANSNRQLSGSAASSTVYGFLNNSVMVQMPGQPGVSSLNFDNLINVSPGNQMYYLPFQSFGCGRVKTFVFSFCLGGLLGDIFYNLILVPIYNALVFFFQQIIEQVIMAFLMIPLQAMSTIFQQGVSALDAPGVNPIIALANMGTMYINFSGHLWLMLLNLAITSALIPILGIFIFALFAFAMPLIFAWVGVMVSIGFTTSYYIPVLPYMIFTFGAIAWLIAVIEAMVAAPIVALGVTHPEGHEAFGKAEAAIMLLMNVFLRPAMMIIGYITAIALSYVGVWLLNAGFDQAISYIQEGGNLAQQWSSGNSFMGQHESTNGTPTYDTSYYGNYGVSGLAGNAAHNSGSGAGYNSWAGIYAFFFSILLYTTMYLTIVQKSFTLIYHLPDKVLRWIGGSAESSGQESAGWTEEAKGKIGEAGTASQNAQGQMDKQLGAMGTKAVKATAQSLGKGTSSGDVQMGGSSTPGGGNDENLAAAMPPAGKSSGSSGDDGASDSGGGDGGDMPSMPGKGKAGLGSKIKEGLGKFGKGVLGRLGALGKSE